MSISVLLYVLYKNLNDPFMVLPLQLLAEEKKKMGEEKAIEIQEQNAIIAVEKAEAEAALDQIKPIMEAAKREVEKLDKAEVTELR